MAGPENITEILERNSCVWHWGFWLFVGNWWRRRFTAMGVMKISLDGNTLALGLLEVLQVRPRPLLLNCRTVWTLSCVLFLMTICGSFTAMYVYHHVWVMEDWDIGHVSNLLFLSCAWNTNDISMKKKTNSVNSVFQAINIGSSISPFLAVPLFVWKFFDPCYLRKYKEVILPENERRAKHVILYTAFLCVSTGLAVYSFMQNLPLFPEDEYNFRFIPLSGASHLVFVIISGVAFLWAELASVAISLYMSCLIASMAQRFNTQNTKLTNLIASSVTHFEQGFHLWRQTYEGKYLKGSSF